jgi:ribosomal-protein-alanine N-acetyltransferase
VPDENPTIEFPGVIHTRRLALRRYDTTDALSILELVDRNRDVLMESFSGMAKGLSAVKGAELFVQKKKEEWDAGRVFCYGVWLQSSKKHVGQIQIKNITRNVPSAELAYFIDGSFQRQGFATEAISAILSVAFTRFYFGRMFVRVLPSNENNILLARKLGFQHEGVHRSEFRCGRGRLHDVHYFSLTGDDYRRL